MEIKCLKLNDLTESVCESNFKVKYLLPNEKAEFINRKHKIIHEQDIIEHSQHRVKVVCPIFYACGACDFLHINYSEQLRMKADFVHRLYQKNNIKTNILPIISNEEPLHYRHKIVASSTTVHKKLKLGLYQENSKNVIPFLDCFIQDELANTVLKSVERLLNKYKIPAYDLDKSTGIIKHILIRKSYVEKKLLVVFVTQGQLFPNAKKIVSELISLHSEIASVVQNIHNKNTRYVLMDDEKILFGKGVIDDQIDGIQFRLSSRSFYQINPVQMIKLYHHALAMANLSKTDVVMDTYSGIGTISLLASLQAKEVIAVESNQSAHQDALFNKKINNIENVSFHHSDVEIFIQGLSKKIDCLIMDPTRDGSSEKFLNALLLLKPQKIIYISCEPKTQVRDLLVLSKLYHILKVQPVDMFSQTKHVETITLLSLKTS